MPYTAPLKKFRVDLVPRERIENLQLVDYYQPIFNDAEDMALEYIFNALPLWYFFMQYPDGAVLTIDDTKLSEFGLNMRQAKHQKITLFKQGYMAETQFPNVFCISDIPFCDPYFMLGNVKIELTKEELSQEKFLNIEHWDGRKDFFYIKKQAREVDENKAYIDKYIKHFSDTFKPAARDLQSYVWLYSWCLRQISSFKNPNFEHFISGEYFLKTYKISYYDTRKAIEKLMDQKYLVRNVKDNILILHEKKLETPSQKIVNQ